MRMMAFVLPLCFMTLTSPFAQDNWPPLAGDRPVETMVESDDIRKKLWDELIAAPRAQAIVAKPQKSQNSWGTWSVSVESNASAFYIVFSPWRADTWPIYAQGAWVIKRARSDGSYIQAKVFLRSDAGTFARIYPAGSRSRIDIIAYGGVLYREVPVNLPFEELLRSPFSRIRELTADIIDWSLFSPDPALYRSLVTLTSAIRERLPVLRYADDGAIDADGRSIFIATHQDQPSPAGLNCSGFAKWLVDGIIHPISGTYLSIASLQEQMKVWRGATLEKNYEVSNDAFFGLDWSRALAASLWGTLYPSISDDSPLSNDVREAPFALRVRDSDPINGGSLYESFPDNFDDAGISLAGLKATLFVLASREPGRFYLAAFNARDRAPPYIRRYFHVAAIFPYFDDDGIFKVAVFESAAETSLQRIVADTDYELVKLIRMPSASRFNPPVLATP